MKTTALNDDTIYQENNPVFKIEKPGQNPEIKIIRSSNPNYTGQTSLIIESKLFNDNNYRIILRDSRAIIIISEHIEINRPLYIHHYDWQVFQQQSYDRMHSTSILLPGDNFYLISHHFIQEKNQLEIILGKTSDN